MVNAHRHVEWPGDREEMRAMPLQWMGPKRLHLCARRVLFGGKRLL